jgi:hypothetical protein
MRPLRLLTLFILLVGGLVTGAVDAADASSHGPVTRVVTYRPFTSRGLAPGLRVVMHDSGPCDEYGRGSKPLIYFRCFGTHVTHGNTFVYDPCFAGRHGAVAPLVCPSLPTSNLVTEFTVTTLNTEGPPYETSVPWAMKLSAGQVCLFANAAWGGLGPYECRPTRGGHAVADCHTPHHSADDWTADCQVHESTSSVFGTRSVAEVWF